MNTKHAKALGSAFSLALLAGVGCAGVDTDLESEEAATTQEAVTFSDNVLVKSLTYDVQRTTRITFSIPADQKLDIRVNARESRTDPFAVLYQAVSTDSNHGGHGRVLAYSDDGSGLNPLVRWTNTTGASVTATLLVFAYSPTTVGTADVVVYKNGGYTTTYSAQAVNGTSLFGDNTGASPGSSSAATQSFETVAASGAPDTFIWVCDLVHQTIAWNDDYSGYLSYVATSPTSDNLSLSAGSHYPSFILAGGYSTGGQATVLQYDNMQSASTAASDIAAIAAQNQQLVSPISAAEQLAGAVRSQPDTSR